MKLDTSRRGFLAAALAGPAAAAPAAPANPKITYRTLGKTGLKVTSVGFGCMVTSDPSVIERAADMGITYFDTARGYSQGNNERMVGAALGARRKNIVLSSKTPGKTKEEALAQLDTSLKELGTDWLDIWYLHAKSKPEDLTDGLLEAQAIAKKAGKIRFAGVSLHAGHAELIPAAIKTGKMDVILVSYNFTMDDAKLGPLVKQISDAGLGVVAMKVMAGRLRPGQTDRAIQVFEREGARLAALKWVLKNPSVHTTVPSITDNDQLEENFRAMAEPFQETDGKLIAAQMDWLSPRYCRACGSCRGTCPQGLPVHDVLRYLTYAEGYGEFALARERFQEMDEELRAVSCRDCSACAVRCPNGVRVPERLIRAQELLA
jgi:predicted aldo/keto reductase-like oxidoreductase